MTAAARVILTLAFLCSWGATAEAQANIFVVRHAEKATATLADKDDPPLSKTGRSRAVALARTLRDVQLSAIVATELKRTQQTAQPIARAAGVEVTTVPAKDTTQLIKKLNATRGNVLVIGHSNTVPEILAALGAEQQITIGDDEYDNLFVWTPATKRLLRLRYR